MLSQNKLKRRPKRLRSEEPLSTRKRIRLGSTPSLFSEDNYYSCNEGSTVSSDDWESCIGDNEYGPFIEDPFDEQEQAYLHEALNALDISNKTLTPRSISETPFRPPAATSNFPTDNDNLRPSSSYSVYEHEYPDMMEDDTDFQYRFYDLNEDINTSKAALYNTLTMYGRDAVSKPTSQKEIDDDVKFIRAIWKHHFDNPGVYNTVGALRHFRNKAKIHSDVDEVLKNFRFHDFFRPLVPSKYDKPDFTGPYIAGPFSQDLENLYKRYGVKKGKWKKFLILLMDREDVPFLDKELARYILRRIAFREQEINKFTGPATHRVGTGLNLAKKPLDLTYLNQLYRNFYGGTEKENIDDRLQQNDYRFMRHLRKYRKHKPGPMDTARAFRYYRKMINSDPNYFSNPKFYYFDNYRIEDPQIVKDYPPDFTGPLLAGPYTHELQDMYERYHVKPGEWRDFLEKLAIDPQSILTDSEIAKYVLGKEKLLKLKLRQNEKDIEKIKKEFYKRATPYDLQKIKEIRERQ